VQYARSSGAAPTKVRALAASAGVAGGDQTPGSELELCARQVVDGDARQLHEVDHDGARAGTA